MRLALALVAALLLVSPAVASQDHIDVIDEAIYAALDAMDTGEGYEEAKADLLAIVLDPLTPPECRRYADIAYVAFLFLEAAEDGSTPLMDYLFEWLMESSVEVQFDCQVAI